MKALIVECFGEMPSRRVIVARLMLLGVLVGMCVVGMLILALWLRIALWIAA